jgi:acetylglutamate kinase
LRSCARTLRHVVGEIDILPSESSDVLIKAIENRAGTGTRIVHGS